MSQRNGNGPPGPRPRLHRGERVLIVGRTPVGETLLRELGHDRTGRCTIVGLVDEAHRTRLERPRLTPAEHLAAIIQETLPDRILVAVDVDDGRVALDPLLDALRRGIVVDDGREAYERLTGRVLLEALRPSDVLGLPRRRRTRWHALAARVLSVAVSLAGLIVLSPLLALIALAIKLDSAGPVCFAQDRLGLGGRRFKLLKFRTMHPAPAPRSEWARDNLDRVTRVGRWLRRFRLDELPQFLNILRGDMNLIGPRPHPATNAALFNARIPYYPLRLVVRPGVTGWAQIRYGYANDLAEETEKMRYDLFYIKHRSLGLDLRILLGTLRAVVLPREPAPARVSIAASSPPPADLEAA